MSPICCQRRSQSMLFLDTLRAVTRAGLKDRVALLAELEQAELTIQMLATGAQWQSYHELKAARDHRLEDARVLIMRLYGSFRWETHTATQEAACKDAEAFLGLPADKRREWNDGK